MRLRLGKLLATRGVAARRKCDALIESGAVKVNGETITAPGAHVDPDRDDVRVNGRRIPGAAAHRYYVLNKPVGMISTLSDPQGRRSLREVLPPGARVFPVGRLDADTSGLLLLTNDGDLAHHLMHPRYGVEKLYRVVVDGRPALKQIEKLQRGVVFEPGVRSAPARVRERDPVARGSVIEIAIAEGRYRQVRRMCEAVGLHVVALHRWGYGPLRLGELERGVWRELSEDEVRLLRAASARPKTRPASVRRPPGRRRGEGIERAPETRAPREGERDPFDVARRGRGDRDVTGWPGETPDDRPRRRARPGAGPGERRPRPAAVDPARRRAETSRTTRRRFGALPGAEESPRRGPRGSTGPAAFGGARPDARPRPGRRAERDAGGRGGRPAGGSRRGREAGGRNEHGGSRRRVAGGRNAGPERGSPRGRDAGGRDRGLDRGSRRAREAGGRDRGVERSSRRGQDAGGRDQGLQRSSRRGRDAGRRDTGIDRGSPRGRDAARGGHGEVRRARGTRREDRPRAGRREDRGRTPVRRAGPAASRRKGPGGGRGKPRRGG